MCLPSSSSPSSSSWFSSVSTYSYFSLWLSFSVVLIIIKCVCHPNHPPPHHHPHHQVCLSRSVHPVLQSVNSVTQPMVSPASSSKSSQSISSSLLSAWLLLNAHRYFQYAYNDDNEKMHCVQIMLCNFESCWSFQPIMTFPGRFVGSADLHLHHHHYWSSKPMTNVPSGFVARADANARH